MAHSLSHGKQANYRLANKTDWLTAMAIHFPLPMIIAFGIPLPGACAGLRKGAPAEAQ